MDNNLYKKLEELRKSQVKNSFNNSNYNNKLKKNTFNNNYKNRGRIKSGG